MFVAEDHKGHPARLFPQFLVLVYVIIKINYRNQFYIPDFGFKILWRAMIWEHRPPLTGTLYTYSYIASLQPLHSRREGQRTDQ